jgi:hypothetical protein
MNLKLFILLIITLSSTFSLKAEDKLLLTTAEGFEETVQLAKDIIGKAYERIGISIDVETQPLERSLHTANNGMSDGELARTISIEKSHPNLIRINVPILDMKVIVLSKGKDLLIEGWKSLKPYSVVTLKGAKLIEKRLIGIDYLSVTHIEQALKMLDKNRVEFAVLPEHYSLLAIKYLKLKGISIHTPAIWEDTLFHYLHKKNKSIIPKITESLKKMQDSGEIQQITEKFYLQYK